MDVSIVIVTWNTREVLRDCLQSIYEQAGRIAFEIIVIDNASSDDTAGMIAREFPTVRLLCNGVNRGFAAANNQGIGMAKGRYILVLNPDTIILDSAIAKTVSFADKHPEAGIVGCHVLNSDGSLQRSCYSYHRVLTVLIHTFGLQRLFPKSRFFGRQDMTWFDFKTVREVEVIAGCFMLVRRKAMEDVGLMDEAYFMYTEETDWCWRMKSQGWKLLFFPDAEIIHLGGVSANQCSLEIQLEAIRSPLLFIKKTQGAVAQWTANLLLLVGTLLRFCWWTCSMPFYRRSTAYTVSHKRAMALHVLKIHFGRGVLFIIKRTAKLVLSAGYFVVLATRQLALHIISNRRQNLFLILYYHNVKSDQKKHFAHQMDMVLRYGKPIFADIDHSTTQHDPLIGITFDDGFYNTMANALPELRQRNIPVIVFIPSGCLGQPPSWIERNANLSRNETVVSIQQLKKLSKDNVLIAAHSVSHRHMTDLSEKEIWLELTESKRELESILGQTVDLFSFPFGEYTNEIIEMAKRAGYRHVFTIEPCPALARSDQFVRGRIHVSPTDWPIEFWLKIRGAYCWLDIAQKVKRKVFNLFRHSGNDGCACPISSGPNVKR